MLEELGVDVGGWLTGLWDALGSVSPAYLGAAVGFQALQTTLTAVAWLFILRAGFPDAQVSFAPVLAAYAASLLG